MATFRLRHFSNPTTLRSIAPERLLNLLDPYRAFFADRGYTLPATGGGEEIDYQSLVDILQTAADSGTPKELLDALFLIDEMSTTEGMDSLLTAAASAGLQLDGGDEHSPADGCGPGMAVGPRPLVGQQVARTSRAVHRSTRMRSVPRNYPTQIGPLGPFPSRTRSRRRHDQSAPDDV